jgi:membrane-bound lytic murein transglycosylase B
MPWLAVSHFEYERRQDQFAALRLLATVEHALGVPADPMLLVDNGAFSGAYAPCAHRVTCPHASARLIDSPTALLWRVEFAVSLEVVEYPQAVFSLIADDRLPVALPAPTLASVDPAAAARRVRPPGARVRRHLVALAAGLAVAATSGSMVGVAAAGTVKDAAPQKAALIRSVTLGTPKAGQPTAGPIPKAHRMATETRTRPAARRHTKPLVATNTAAGVTLAAVAGGSEKRHSTGPAHHVTSGQNGDRHRRHHQHRHRHHHHHHSAHPKASGTDHKGTQSRGSGKAAVAPAAAPTLRAPAAVNSGGVTTIAPSFGHTGSGGSGGFQLDPAAVAALSQASSSLATGDQPPAFLIPIYKAAGARYHVPWQILAAINWIETDYGANLNTSSAGAIGWMQFMPGTWQEYAVAADGQGKPNPYNPLDAIFTAAHYLAANGAAKNLPNAIYAYNHAGWYVAEVMLRAQIISDHAYASTGASLAGGLGLDPATIAALSRAPSLRATGNQPPAFLIPIYKAAATRYHVPWRILAAMNWIETDYGSNLNTASAGSMGWMQFTPGMWHKYGVAADGHGKPNPYSPLDAIFSAAHYLAANGAAKDLPKAIYGYDQATFYVVDVMQRARMIRDQVHATTARSLAGAGQSGLAGAVTMLLAAYSAVGGPYSQANHDSFGQTAADLRLAGTDCSGFVSWVLDQVDPGFGTQTTVTLPAQAGVVPGVGQYVTMWDRPLPGDQGHVIIDILGTWFESGGNTAYNPAGGIAPMSETEALGELTGGGFLPYHLERL